MMCRVPDQDLSALLDGELEAVEERLLRDHVSACPSCRRSVQEFRRVSNLVRGSEGRGLPAPSPRFVTRVVRAAGAVKPARKPAARLVRLPGPPLVPAAAAAVLLLVLGLGAVLALSGSPSAPLARDSAASGAPPALAELPEGWDAPSEYPVVRERSPVPRGPGLPAPPAVRRPERLTGDALYRAMGMRKVGDRWFSEEAYGRFREHREQEAQLARARERNESRPRVVETPNGVPAHPVGVDAGLASLGLGEAALEGELTLYPLVSEKPAREILAYGLEEGLQKRILEIREDQASATLFAENRDGKRYAFLALGEILVGGHQDRVVTRDTLIPPGLRMQVPVLCCEEGRSTGPTGRFTASPGLAPAGIRGLIYAARDQGAVWQRISADLTELRATNETSSLRFLFEAGRASDLAERVEKLLPALSGPRVVGFMAVARNGVIGVEVFGSHGLFQIQAPRFVASYLLEAEKQEPAAANVAFGSPDQLQKLLEGLARARVHPARGGAVALEAEIAQAPGGLSGFAVSAGGDSPLHVSLFSGAPAGKAAGGSGRTSAPGGTAPPPPQGPPARNGQESRGQQKRMDERKRGMGVPPEQRAPGNVVPPRTPNRTPQNPPRTPRRTAPPPDRNDPPKVPDRSDRR